MNRDRERDPITRPVIGQAMDGRRLGDNATFALTVDEQLRVNTVRQVWLGESDPD